MSVVTTKRCAGSWIPSHIGIRDNPMVDQQAQTSLSLDPTYFNIPVSNFKPLHLSISISWVNDKLRGITSLEIHFLG